MRLHIKYSRKTHRTQQYSVLQYWFSREHTAFVVYNNWRPSVLGAEPAMDAVDWRTQLQPDSRKRIVNKIMETLRRHLPFSEGIMELKKIAERIEEKIYSAAISQSDYLRKISMKMLTMETRSQGSMPNSQDAGGAEQALHAVDWRTQLQPDSQQRTVFKIMETLKRLHPFAGIGKILELKKMAEQFEEKIYSGATSQDDYLKKIYMEIAMLEAKHQDAIPCPLSNSSVNCGKIPDSGAQAGNISVGDWQEEVYQKIKAMKAIYFPELNNLYQNIASKIQKHDSLPDQLCQKLDKLKISKKTLDRLFAILLVSRNDLLPIYKENLWSYEMEILNILDANMPLKTVPSMQQGQLGQSLMQSMHLIPQVQPPESQTSSPMQSMNSQASLDSKTQKGNVGGDDWQEEVYQKIKAMKEIYLPELNDMYQKIVAKMQQHDSLLQQPKSEQLDKLKIFKKMLERIIAFLQVSKKNVLPGFKEKLSSYEMQILNCLNINKPRKPMPSKQQGQLGQPQMQSMQQLQPLISQAQPHENQINPQMQSMNSQGALELMLQNSLSSLPGISAPQQPGRNLSLALGNQLSSAHLVNSGLIQQNAASASQQRKRSRKEQREDFNLNEQPPAGSAFGN